MSETPTEERGLRSVADLANDGSGIEEEDDGQLAIAGTSPKLSLEVGGNKPTVSVAKIKALKLPVRNADDPDNPGQFKKGDRVRAIVDLVCVDLSFPDERRKGKVERTQRVHVFEPEAIEILPSAPNTP